MENINGNETVKLCPIPYPVNAQKILAGKVALITGGSGGIGFAMAKAFLECGCKVIICGTNEKKLRDCRDKLNDVGGAYMLLNVLDVETMPEKIEQAANMFDEKKIDILVNSAGVITHSRFDKMTVEEYDSIMDINVKGTFFMCQAMSAYMIKHNIKGHILNLSSSSALRPAWNVYQISKRAISAFTQGLADTLLPYGIIVNAIGPGAVATEMWGKDPESDLSKPGHPSGRYSVPSEIAALAAFMVSDFGNLIVGETYYITGGSGSISYHN